MFRKFSNKAEAALFLYELIGYGEMAKIAQFSNYYYGDWGAIERCMPILYGLRNIMDSDVANKIATQIRKSKWNTLFFDMRKNEAVSSWVYSTPEFYRRYITTPRKLWRFKQMVTRRRGKNQVVIMFNGAHSEAYFVNTKEGIERAWNLLTREGV